MANNWAACVNVPLVVGLSFQGSSCSQGFIQDFWCVCVWGGGDVWGFMLSDMNLMHILIEGPNLESVKFSNEATITLDCSFCRPFLYHTQLCLCSLLCLFTKSLGEGDIPLPPTPCTKCWFTVFTVPEYKQHTWERTKPVNPEFVSVL